MPVTFKHETLENGLTIIGECDEAAHSAACGFFVKTGARDEPGELMGVSHFLEHMMFKGTDTLTAEDINRAFDDMGARNNAFTSGEMTCFHAHVLPERLGEAVDVLATMMRPALREDDFDVEKGVILEEIAMYKDNPFWVLYEEVVERHYRPHPLGHRVLGTEETVGRMTAEQMRGYFHDRYSADNTVVSLAGNLNFDHCVEKLKLLCERWPTTGATRDNTAPPTRGEAFELRKPNLRRGYILGIAEGPAMDDERMYASALLSQVLGASDNSRLHWALIETGIADEAQSAFDANDGTGSYLVYASCGPARLDEVWSIVQREIDGLIESVTDEDLERLRNKLLTGATLGGERPADRMQRLGRIWNYLGRYRSLEEELELINAVTLDDLRAVREAFPMRPMTVGRLLPEG